MELAQAEACSDAMAHADHDSGSTLQSLSMPGSSFEHVGSMPLSYLAVAPAYIVQPDPYLGQTVACGEQANPGGMMELDVQRGKHHERTRNTKTEDKLDAFHPEKLNWINVAKPLRHGVMNMHEQLTRVENQMWHLNEQFRGFRMTLRETKSQHVEQLDSMQQLLEGICSFKPVRRAVRRHLRELPSDGEDESEGEEHANGTASGSFRLTASLKKTAGAHFDEDAAQHIASKTVTRLPWSASRHQHQVTTHSGRGQSLPPEDTKEQAFGCSAVAKTGPLQKEGFQKTQGTPAELKANNGENPSLSSPLATASELPSKKWRSSLAAVIALGKLSGSMGVSEMNTMTDTVSKSSDEENADDGARLAFLERAVKELDEKYWQEGRDYVSLKEQIQRSTTSTSERIADLSLKVTDEHVRRLCAEVAQDQLLGLLHKLGAVQKPTNHEAGLLFRKAADSALATELQQARDEIQASILELEKRLSQLESEFHVEAALWANMKSTNSAGSLHTIDGTGDAGRRTSRGELRLGSNLVSVLDQEAPDRESSYLGCAELQRVPNNKLTVSVPDQEAPDCASSYMGSMERKTPTMTSVLVESRVKTAMEAVLQKVSADVEHRVHELEDLVMREEEMRKESDKAAEEARLQEAETLRCRLEEVASNVDEFQKQQTSILETCKRTVARVPHEQARWGENFAVKVKEGMDDFVNQYREERRKFNERLCVLFPRAAAMTVDTQEFTISEARLFAQDVRLDAMEEQIGRLSAEKAEMQAHVLALRHGTTSSTQPEGIASRSGSHRTSRKVASVDWQVTVSTNGAAAQQLEEINGQPSTFNDRCILGSQVVPGTRNRPTGAQEMQRNPAALALANGNEQLLERSSSSASCNRKRPQSAACRTAVLTSSRRQREVHAEPSPSPSRSPSVQRGNELEQDQDVLSLHPQSNAHGFMERAANSVHGQVLAAPTSARGNLPQQDCSLPAKVRRDRSGMRSQKTATSAARVSRPHSAKAQSVGAGNHRGHAAHMSPN